MQSRKRLLRRGKRCPVLLDDLPARRFAVGLGLVGSIGVLIKSTIEHKISKEEALDALEKLAKVMWLRIDVYEDARKAVGGLK
jgi:predicted nucleic acid-binding protein